MSLTPIELSIVVPIHNEEGNILLLIERLQKALYSFTYEIIFVDDGSKDKSVFLIQEAQNPSVKLIQFTRNFGQTAAMAAGINEAAGQFIATLDGDLQNDPDDIPYMLQKLKKEQLDIVAGKRRKRKDSLLWRKVPSKIANWLIRKMTNIHIQDYGCTLKVFKAALAKELDLQGELHRFIPILAVLEGARLGEMEVKHHARHTGITKYGIWRTLSVLSDLCLMLFFLKYRQKPMHLFGILGLICFFIGSVIEIYLLILKMMGENIGGRPLFYIGIVMLITAVQFVTTGFISEVLMRTLHAARGTKPYKILSSSKEK